MTIISPELVRDWKQKARRHNYSVEAGRYDAAMTFDEIASALGTDRQHVWHWYASAIKKLRANPEALARLLSLAEALAAEKERRTALQGINEL